MYTINYPDQHSKLKELLDTATKIVVIQADNPDGDSLASSLALEQILEEAGKKVVMYCAVEVPRYLKHLEGWDRVQKFLPSQYDLAIIVDTSAASLLEVAEKDNTLNTIKSKPLVVLDHHPSEPTIDFAEVMINDTGAVATGEVIFKVAKDIGLDIDEIAGKFICASILSDTLGLTTSNINGKGDPFRIIGELVETGVDLSVLNNNRLEASKIEPRIVGYKADLLKRIEFLADDRIARLHVPQEEIAEFSSSYNPTVVLDEMRFVEGVKLMLGFKEYKNRNGVCNRITIRIRCTFGNFVAKDIAEAFGGGGHRSVAGTKIEGPELDFDDVMKQVTDKAIELLDLAEQEE